jgi:DNA topoisomerase-1
MCGEGALGTLVAGRAGEGTKRCVSEFMVLNQRLETEPRRMTSDLTAATGRQRAEGADKPATTLTPTTRALMKRAGLRHVGAGDLAIRRRRCGRGWVYLGPDDRRIDDRATVRRLARLAVPPAYQDVLYAADPAAHLQAVGRDSAGRLQYRYHQRWEGVREIRKARRLARLADALPRIHRSLGRHLASPEPTRQFAFAAVVELVALTAIRPGSESYARLRGTRGAATLLKSNVAIYGETITLTFRGKGGKTITKEFTADRFANVIVALQQLPGRRLFQYRAENGELRHVAAREVNAFLREIAGVRISLKDFRTLLASASVFETLARAEPAATERKRRKQLLEAVRIAAGSLANTPAICRKSYVHHTVVAAFEAGALERFSNALKRCRSTTGRAQLLTKVISADADLPPHN